MTNDKEGESMAEEVKVPQMGESIAEGTIVRWLKKVGDTVKRDEPLFEISTDKVDAEIPSPVSGTLLEIKVQEGETVAVNTVVATIGEAGEKAATEDAPAAAPPAPAPPAPPPAPTVAAQPAPPPVQAQPAPPPPQPQPDGAPEVAPATAQASSGSASGEEVKMPQMGESIAEGTIVRWLKKVGDQVKRDEPLFEISTDKVDAEIPSPVSGVLSEIKVNEGETVAVNTVVAVINGGGAKPAAAPEAAKAAEPAKAAESAKPEEPPKAAEPAKPAPAAAPKPSL